MVSAAELQYTLEGVAVGLREDGRALLDCRHSSLDVGVLPQAGGSCRLKSGSSELLVGVVAALAKPDAHHPAMGRITVSVGCGPGDAVYAGLPEYEALANGALDPESKRLWLERALNQLYGPAVVPDALRTLCIVPGRQCWELKAHVQLLRADGCPLDAAAVALRAALHNTRVPRVNVTVAGGAAGSDGVAGAPRLDLDLDETLDESSPFDETALPLCVTLADLGGQLLADCTAKERRAAGSALSLAIHADGHIASLCGGGGFGLHLATLDAALAASRVLGAELHAATAAAISDADVAAERMLSQAIH